MEIDVRQADLEDLEEISAFAGQILSADGSMLIRQWAQKSAIGASAGNAFRHPGRRMLKCCMAEEEWARHCLSLGFALLAPASAPMS